MAKAKASAKPAEKVLQFGKIGSYTTESCFKHTGKYWDEWIAILNKAGAKKWVRKDIAKFLKTKYKLRPWWQQAVAWGYELAVGNRVEGQSPGGFSSVTTKTFPIGAPQLWDLAFSDEGLARWLKPISHFSLEPKHAFETRDDVYGEVRTIHPKKRIRMTWTETEWKTPAVLEIHFVPRPKGKSMIVFQMSKLADGRVRSKMKTYWLKAVGDLLELASS